MTRLFDPHQRRLRRQRAIERGVDTDLIGPVVEDLRERVHLMQFPKQRALLIGALDDRIAPSFGTLFETLDIVEPARSVAVDPTQFEEAVLDFAPERFDAIIALGTLDTADPLPEILMRLRFLLRPDRPLLGAMVGGQSFRRLSLAMQAADAADGRGASPHVHPRIEPAALTTLLANAGFAMPVVDVDRLHLRYPSLKRLVSDLRSFGGTNILVDRNRRPLSRDAANAARAAFMADAASDGKVVETVEILHFAAWSPPN